MPEQEITNAEVVEKRCKREGCGKPVRPNKFGHYSFGDYCSRSCYCKARIADIPKRECPVCHKLFKPFHNVQIYCSKACKYRPKTKEEWVDYKYTEAASGDLRVVRIAPIELKLAQYLALPMNFSRAEVVAKFRVYGYSEKKIKRMLSEDSPPGFLGLVEHFMHSLHDVKMLRKIVMRELLDGIKAAKDAGTKKDVLEWIKELKSFIAIVPEDKGSDKPSGTLDMKKIAKDAENIVKEVDKANDGT